MSTEVAIIGAGLSGLSLALALHQQNISSTIYEARADAPLNIGGAIMLSPNALRILDRLGLYSSMQSQGYNFNTLEFRDAFTPLSSTITTPPLRERQEFGSEAKYGYSGMRIYRTQLIDTLLNALRTAGIKIEYGKKFSHVIEERADSVTFQFTDGSRSTAPLLIGADGIHSSVRRYLHPSITARFMGMAGVSASVPTSQVQAPPDLQMPVAYVRPDIGAFVLAPQQPDGSEIFFGRQRRIEGSPTRAELDAMAADTDSLRAFLQADAAKWPTVVQNTVSHIEGDTIRFWPFHAVPKLDTWSSEDKHRRVVILGDAAHAIPPSAGQGINQAFEDVYLFARLVGAAHELASEAATTKEGKGGKAKGDPMQDALRHWQTYRQARVERVLELNKLIDARRLPKKDGEEQDDGVGLGDLENLEWLYNADFDAVVQDWLDGRKAEESVKRVCPVEKLFGWKS